MMDIGESATEKNQVHVQMGVNTTQTVNEEYCINCHAQTWSEHRYRETPVSALTVRQIPWY